MTSCKPPPTCIDASPIPDANDSRMSAIPYEANLTPISASPLRYSTRGRFRARDRCPALPGRDARALGGVCADAASGQDPPDRVWPLRGGPARPARARQTGDLLLPGVHPHLRAIPPGHLPAPAEESHRPHAGDPAEGQGCAAAAHASADPRGRWLTQVVRGCFAYHAVPTNRRALMAF